MQQSIRWSVGGVVVLAWLWSPWEHSGLMVGLLAAIALFLVVWQSWGHTSAQSAADNSVPIALTLTQVRAALEVSNQILKTLAEMSPDAATTWQPVLTQLQQDAERQQLRVGLRGEPGVGKSALRECLTQQWLAGLSEACTLIEVPWTAATLANPDVVPKLSAASPDLTLFLTTGDLTEAAYQQLLRLQDQQRVIVVLTQTDRLLPDQLLTLQQRLKERLPTSMERVAVAAQPQAVKVRRHQGDGAVIESWETPEADLEALTTRLTSIVKTEAQQLIWQHTYRQNQGLQQSLWFNLHQIRRDRALPIIERYQWITAATAFANPVPALDLLATSAIATKLIVELGALYGQSLSLAQAKGLATIMAKLLIQLGVVELSTQTLMGCFKGNSFTFVAGGLCQGASAAYLTRIAGLSLIEHFQLLCEQGATGALDSASGLEPIMRRVFEANQKLDVLKDLAQQTLKRLRPNLETVEINTSAGTPTC